MQSHDEEQALVARLRRRESEAFTELVRLYQHRVFGLLLRIMGQPDEAEELAQEVFVNVYRGLDSFRGESSLRTWIYRIALNVAIDSHRKRRQRNKEQLGLDGDLEPASGRDPVVTEQLQELRELLERQSEVDRAILLLHLEGNSHREIGEVLGFSESNIGTRLSRLKATLRQSVQSTET